MTASEFSDGIKQIQAALQGEFPRDFLAFLWSRFEKVESPVWRRMVELACRLDKQARQVIAADFYRIMGVAREEEHHRVKPPRNGKEVGELVPFSRICEIFKDGFWGEQAQAELRKRTHDRK